jgi:uncharacterized protein (DUF2345 family)
MLVEFLEAPGEQSLTLSTNAGKQLISLVQKGSAAIQITSEGPIEVTAKKDVKVETSGGNVSIKGTKVSIEASSDLELKGMNVKVTGSAGVDVKGPQVKVAADATAEVSGGATTTIKGGLVRIN